MRELRKRKFGGADLLHKISHFGLRDFNYLNSVNRLKWSIDSSRTRLRVIGNIVNEIIEKADLLIKAAAKKARLLIYEALKKPRLFI